jgi:hypothetical protein
MSSFGNFIQTYSRVSDGTKRIHTDWLLYKIFNFLEENTYSTKPRPDHYLASQVSGDIFISTLKRRGFSNKHLSREIGFSPFS